MSRAELPEIQDSALVRLSLVRPITVLMALLSAAVLGVIALINIPLELIPSGFSPPFLRVAVPYANASAKDIEEKITRPLEEQLATTPRLDRMSATSTPGSASITLLFEGDTDMDVAYREVRDRVARVRPELPSDVQKVTVNKASAGAIPVAFYGINWEPSVREPFTLVDRHLVRAVERIEGVAIVNLFGQRDPEIRIEVDRAAADAANLNIFNLVQTLGQSNFTLASGTIEDRGGTYLVRSVASYGSLDEIRGIVVGPNDLRLGDVAKVVYDLPESERYDRYNGKPSMVLFVVKESTANTVDVSDRVRAAIDEAKRHPALQSFGVEPIFLQGDTIRSSLQQVVDSGVQGGAIAVVVLLFFLQRLTLTLIIALSIPLSLFLALPVMYFTGASINLVSLIGLMICVGLVVDNSVVVAENIERFRARGMGPYAAALHGASEVALAITLATMTTMVVFLPAALLSSGPTQFFMIRMVTPVCISLLASLFVALALIPLAGAFIASRRERRGAVAEPRPGRLRQALRRADRAWKAALHAAYELSFGRMNRGYVALLRWALRRRFDVVLVSLAAMASWAIPVRNVRFVAEQAFGGRSVDVDYSMPSDTTLEQADAFFRTIEQQLASFRESGEFPIEGQYIGFDANFGEIQIFFKPQAQDEDRDFREIAKELVDRLPTRPGFERYTSLGDSDGAKASSFDVAIYGDEHDAVQAAKTELEAALLRIDGVVGLKGRGADGRRRDELALRVDRGLSERYGVPSSLVANTVSTAIRGASLPRYQGDEREVDVSVRYRKSDRADVEALLGFGVPSTTTGRTLPLRVLADKQVTLADTGLVRDNKRTAALVSVELDPERREQVVQRIRAFVAAYQLPEGLSFDADAEQRDLDSSLTDLIAAMVLGSVFIFLIMGFLFESFVLPLSVMPSIPLSFVGVWWFLWLTGENIDSLAGIGIILLLGVVVNNGIVLVDFVNAARRLGLDRDQALVDAGNARFRPIMMTALTTVGGMLPLAFARHTGEGIAYNAFGKALVGGMVSATVLTLVVVPVTYAYLDDLRSYTATWWTRLRAGRGVKPAAR
jgi:HAE1 family hydrophobic/amphiphilic exporter-1